MTLLPVYTLWQREIVRFLRQKNRVFGAVGQPILFWLVFGSSFSASFRPQSFSNGASYLEYFYPGILMMIVLFTAIFSSFSIIEDRTEGFLQAAWASPAARWQLVFGKVLGGATLALLQAMVFLCFIPFLHLSLTLPSVIFIILVLFLTAIGLAAFGFALAWRMDSVQGFHAIMMLILLPMWFLSGAFFPSQGLPLVLEWILKLNPLTYALSLLRHMLYEAQNPMLSALPSFEISLGVTLGFSILTLIWAWKLSQKWTS
ncbi:MAG: hypothetical protein A3B70_00560 [Deltaproteobacteria bacterium RIFCSPHIGHO2_02_FULL_40_11]|nr:MAG: hypothetical protein A3B70_00560 [Deltaproteobacteria bacterium RIFCSPHIGHO2_02_FULL_40_11]